MNKEITTLIKIEPYVKEFFNWYVKQCKRQNIPCDGSAYDLPDAYADWVESKR